MRLLITSGYKPSCCSIIKKSGITYDEFCNLKMTTKKESQFKEYSLKNFTTEELIKGVLNNKIPLYLNQLFRERQLTKEQLIEILDSSEFKKKTKVMGSDISTRDSAIRSMVKQQKNCDGEILEKFYEKFSSDPDCFCIDALKFIGNIKKKEVAERCRKNMPDELKLLLELM